MEAHLGASRTTDNILMRVLGVDVGTKGDGVEFLAFGQQFQTPDAVEAHVHGPHQGARPTAGDAPTAGDGVYVIEQGSAEDVLAQRQVSDVTNNGQGGGATTLPSHPADRAALALATAVVS
eukprot:COSAG05_NODE_502_length_9214_cov_3.816676_1_plen_121_part_00